MSRGSEEGMLRRLSWAEMGSLLDEVESGRLILCEPVRAMERARDERATMRMGRGGNGAGSLAGGCKGPVSLSSEFEQL